MHRKIGADLLRTRRRVRGSAINGRSAIELEQPPKASAGRASSAPKARRLFRSTDIRSEVPSAAFSLAAHLTLF